MTFRGNHVDELVSASLAGDLTDAQRAELDAHLARCERCRATLAAFTAERRILSGMPVVDPPRDLSARVRSGIESGRLGSPWWRRPGGLVAIGASMATVAAAILAVVVFSNLDGPPVGQASGSPLASGSSAPGPSAVETSPATASATPGSVIALGPGALGYLSLNGAPFEASRLTFVNDATGASINAGTVSGPPIAAALSRDGSWLAYITRKGETGANEVWALDLDSGTVTHLGCSTAAPFTDRLAWSPDSSYLAYTLVGTDLSPANGCEAAGPGADVWLFDTKTSQHAAFTSAGNAYAADFALDLRAGNPQLWVSFASEQPLSTLISVPGGGSAGSGDQSGSEAHGVFLPLLSPDGNRALFWSGTMAATGVAWEFSLGGMPQLSGDFRSTGPASPWLGTQLFTDLVPVGGEAFASGTFTWAADSDKIAFWNGAWTGAPQSPDGTYPTQRDVYYVGSIRDGLLNLGARFAPISGKGSPVDLTFGPGGSFAMTVSFPSAGIGDPPSAELEVVCCGGDPRIIGGGVEPPPWDGPAVFGR